MPPLKIVHASNFSLRDNGANYYSMPYKLTNGLIRLGHFVFNFCDRDIASANPLRIRKLGEGRANAKLIAVCREVRPDLLLLGHCTIISPDTIATIRAMLPGLRVAHWNCDGLFVEKNCARLQAVAPLADMSFVTTAGEDLRQVVVHGGHACFMPNPLDASVETLRVFECDDVANDLVFLTGFNRYDTEKLEKCELIRTRLPDLAFDIRGLFGNDGVWGAQLFDVLAQAKMGLNISKRNDVRLYSSDRMAQLMGCGLLTLIDRRTGFDTIFAPDEIVTYAGDEEMIDKIDYFRRHDGERRAIAERGWRRAHAIFSETLVAQWIVDATLNGRPSRDYAWPTAIVTS